MLLRAVLFYDFDVPLFVKYKHNKSDMQAICNQISVQNQLIDKFIFNFSITNSENDNEFLQNNQNIFGRTVFFITTIMIVIVKYNCGVKNNVHVPDFPFFKR